VSAETDRVDRCWRQLRQALTIECQQVGGYGKIGFEVTYSDGVPVRITVLNRLPSYRLDRPSVDTDPPAE
jgi:hypothetical protein